MLVFFVFSNSQNAAHSPGSFFYAIPGQPRAISHPDGTESVNPTSEVYDLTSPATTTTTTWLHLMRGVRPVIQQHWEVVLHGPLGLLLHGEWNNDPPLTKPAAQREDQQLAALSALWEIDAAPADTAEAATYDDTLSQLRRTFARADAYSTLTTPLAPSSDATIKSGSFIPDPRPSNFEVADMSIVLAWISSIAPTYVALLEQQRPPALILLAHWAVLLSRIHNVWWVEGVGVDILAAVRDVLENEWSTWLEWPRKMIGLEGKYEA
jgi:hypothetical protein